jgi:hypothetical protein
MWHHKNLLGVVGILRIRLKSGLTRDNQTKYQQDFTKQQPMDIAKSPIPPVIMPSAPLTEEKYQLSFTHPCFFG